VSSTDAESVDCDVKGDSNQANGTPVPKTLQLKT